MAEKFMGCVVFNTSRIKRIVAKNEELGVMLVEIMPYNGSINSKYALLGVTPDEGNYVKNYTNENVFTFAYQCDEFCLDLLKQNMPTDKIIELFAQMEFCVAKKFKSKASIVEDFEARFPNNVLPAGAFRTIPLKVFERYHEQLGREYLKLLRAMTLEVLETAKTTDRVVEFGKVKTEQDVATVLETFFGVKNSLQETLKYMHGCATGEIKPVETDGSKVVSLAEKAMGAVHDAEFTMPTKFTRGKSSK